MIDYASFYTRLQQAGLGGWQPLLAPLTDTRLAPANHGDLPRWYAALAALPRIDHDAPDLNAACLRVGPVLEPAARAQLTELLQQFHPWRKGPFCLHGVHVDTEWRSDLKWERVKHAVELRGKRVLDVGCGNGYYGWRMVGAGADWVLGIDPTLLYVMQYAAVRQMLGDAPIDVLPLKLEELPAGEQAFDVVFSMGVLYHRRDPMEHLRALGTHLRPGGQLLLETLVVEGGAGEVLVPGERYAKMKNVWAIPSIATALQWLAETGYAEPRCVDVTPTTAEEQRATAWMRFESLADFLDPHDPRRTCEGHSAPIRAVFTATRP